MDTYIDLTQQREMVLVRKDQEILYAYVHSSVYESGCSQRSERGLFPDEYAERAQCISKDNSQ